MTITREIRPGERIEYRIVRYDYGDFRRYRVEWRNPDTVTILRSRWWQFWRPKTFWRWVMKPGIYGAYIADFTTCADAEAGIDSDIRQRRGRAEGWVPVRCADEKAENQ